MSPFRPQGLHVTETTLTCSGFHHIAPEVVEAIKDWLHEHDLHENNVVAGHPIIRDPERGTLTSTQGGNSIREPMVVVDQAPLGAKSGTWPAPFPEILLQQQLPEVCPACQRPLDGA